MAKPKVGKMLKKRQITLTLILILLALFLIAQTCSSPVTFDSEPQGADVYVDGKIKGVTPIIISVAGGQHNIKYSKSGYEDLTFQIQVLNAQEISKTLTPIGQCQDLDADGYGKPASASCQNAELDCNDDNANVNPGVSEICTDGIDNNCDGAIDSGDSVCAACPDADADGYCAMPSNANLFIGFDEGDAPFHDLVAGNDASCTGGCPAVVPGKVGNAVQFDGTNYLTITDSDALTLNGDFTISMWIKTSMPKLSSYLHSVVTNWQVDTQQPFWAIEAANGRLSYRTKADDGTWNGDGTGEVISDGNWHHFALTRSADTWKFYIDGELSRISPVKSSSPINPVLETRIGQSVDGGYGFNGFVDQLSIFNRALSDLEIKEISLQQSQFDCDDGNNALNPGAVEVCDNVDNNCNGAVDEGFNNVDSDNDLYTTCGGDCDDSNPSINPSMQELCDNGIDDNCDGQDETQDYDNDGYTVCGGDCWDYDANMSPGIQLESCGDLRDNNCRAGVDEGCSLCQGGVVRCLNGNTPQRCVYDGTNAYYTNEGSQCPFGKECFSDISFSPEGRRIGKTGCTGGLLFLDQSNVLYNEFGGIKFPDDLPNEYIKSSCVKIYNSYVNVDTVRCPELAVTRIARFLDVPSDLLDTIHKSEGTAAVYCDPYDTSGLCPLIDRTGGIVDIELRGNSQDQFTKKCFGGICEGDGGYDTHTCGAVSCQTPYLVSYQHESYQIPNGENPDGTTKYKNCQKCCSTPVVKCPEGCTGGGGYPGAPPPKCKECTGISKCGKCDPGVEGGGDKVPSSCKSCGATGCTTKCEQGVLNQLRCWWNPEAPEKYECEKTQSSASGSAIYNPLSGYATGDQCEVPTCPVDKTKNCGNLDDGSGEPKPICCRSNQNCPDSQHSTCWYGGLPCPSGTACRDSVGNINQCCPPSGSPYKTGCGDNGYCYDERVCDLSASGYTPGYVNCPPMDYSLAHCCPDKGGYFESCELTPEGGRTENCNDCPLSHYKQSFWNNRKICCNPGYIPCNPDEGACDTNDWCIWA